MGDSIPFIQGGEDMTTKHNEILLVWITICLLGGALLPLYQVFPSANAVPVIIEEEHAGSWTDIFNDSSGVEISDNLSINTNNVKLSTYPVPLTINWDHEYTADAEPDTVGWTLSENAAGDLASASGGLLTIDTTPENAYWDYGSSWGASNSIGATFEARLQVVSNSQIAIIIWLRDGTYYEGLKFYTDRIEMFIDTSNNYFMDTTDDFHVYRFTIKNDDYMVYVDDVLVIDGTDQHTSTSAGNSCSFGDFADTAGYESNSIWDYIKYNISGAFPPTEPFYFLDGNLTSIKIHLPVKMMWNNLTIGKTQSGPNLHFNVSILDGETYEPIPGFENFTGNTVDLLTIDYIMHPTIRLYANFVGNDSATPILHDWNVTWIDAPPATPTGFTVNNPWTGYSLILSWNANQEPDVGRYVLYFSTDNFTFLWLANVLADIQYYQHYGLTAGTTYYYKIAAVDDEPNLSPFSEVVEGIPDSDMDNDGTGDTFDPDVDGDTVPNGMDDFPLNPNEWLDTDGDGTGDNADIDDDDDGHNDVNDAFPFDDTEWLDFDGDGIGDNADLDDDNDGVDDLSDPYPYNDLNGLQYTINDINNTLNDLQIRIMDIQSDLDVMNITVLKDTLEYLNQTLPILGNFSAELSEINRSILDRLTESEINILSALQSVNNSLFDDIQNLLASITNDIIGMNSSILNQLTDLLDNITTEQDALQQWLNIVFKELDDNLTTTNFTLHQQMNDLDFSLTTFYNSLTSDIGDIQSVLQLHDKNTGQNHSDTITLLDDLLDGQIEKVKITELKTILENLAENMSGYNQSLADDILVIVDNIDEFKGKTDEQLERINETLDNIAKLEVILSNIEALNQDLDDGNQQLQDSISEIPTEKKEEEAFGITEGLLIIVLVLLIINLVLTLTLKGRKRAEEMTFTKDNEVPESNDNRDEVLSEKGDE